MSIISDALRKGAQGRQAQAQRSLQPHETSTSGRWKMLRKLKTKNTELYAGLREAGKDVPDEEAPVSRPLSKTTGRERAPKLVNDNTMWGQTLGWIIESESTADIWVRGGAGEPLTAVERARYEHLTEALFWTAQNERRLGKLQQPDTKAYLVGAMFLSIYLRDKPGLKARFDEWGKDVPIISAALSRDMEELERLRQNR